MSVFKERKCSCSLGIMGHYTKISFCLIFLLDLVGRSNVCHDEHHCSLSDNIITIEIVVNTGGFRSLSTSALIVFERLRLLHQILLY